MSGSRQFFNRNRSLLVVYFTLMLIITAHTAMWAKVKRMEILLKKPFAVPKIGLSSFLYQKWLDIIFLTPYNFTVGITW